MSRVEPTAFEHSPHRKVVPNEKIVYLRNCSSGNPGLVYTFCCKRWQDPPARTSSKGGKAASWDESKSDYCFSRAAGFSSRSRTSVFGSRNSPGPQAQVSD